MGHQFTFYVETVGDVGDDIRFSAEESHHIGQVLRISKNDVIRVADGRGNQYHVRLIEHLDGCWQGRVLSRESTEETAPIPVTVTLPCLKGDRWQVALEGCCEMGVEEVILVDFESSVTRWSEARVAKAKRKAVEILKQSGGSMLTQIVGPQSLSEAVGRRPESTIFLADASGDTLGSVPAHSLIIVGPEAGLTGAELNVLKNRTAALFRLGRRRLRSEIAVITAIAQVAQLQIR